MNRDELIDEMAKVIANLPDQITKMLDEALRLVNESQPTKDNSQGGDDKDGKDYF